MLRRADGQQHRQRQHRGKCPGKDQLSQDLDDIHTSEKDAANWIIRAASTKLRDEARKFKDFEWQEVMAATNA
jgi:hypothetical protein